MSPHLKLYHLDVAIVGPELERLGAVADILPVAVSEWGVVIVMALCRSCGKGTGIARGPSIISGAAHVPATEGDDDDRVAMNDCRQLLIESTALWV